MAFWGVEVKPGKVTPFVPPPEGSKLHLSQASLSPSAAKGGKAALKVKVGDGEALVVCCLREGGAESLGLDLIFDAYTEFSVEGKSAIHLTGYFMPEYDLDDSRDFDDDDDDDEDQRALMPGGMQVLGYDENGVPILAGEYDSEEDSDYESEEGEEDSDLPLDSDEDDEDESDEEGDDGLRQLGRGRRVEIREITDDEPADGEAKSAAKATQANGKAAQFDDEDVEASEEEDEEDSEEDEEEEESEEEAPVQHAGQKRKAGASAQNPAGAKDALAAKKQAVEKQQAGGKPAAASATPAGLKAQQAQQKQQVKAEKGAKQQEQQQPQAKTPQPQQAAKTPAKTPAKEEGVVANELPSSNKKVRRFANGFEIEDLKVGRADAKLAKPGKKVVVKYVGKLKSNGKIFDQTAGNKTFAFRLGVGEVIKGWDKGVENMRVGDKRRLTIPPQMAYGTSGIRGAIPPNAWLSFEVELVDVK